jgi:quercetin dioxygenase-like cupin family protein
MKVLPVRELSSRQERPASAVVHDEANVRVVAFHLLQGQEVPPHHSASTVSLHVVEGTGLFQGESGEATLSAGEVAVFAPGEMHAIRAPEGSLRFLAMITPRPS